MLTDYRYHQERRNEPAASEYKMGRRCEEPRTRYPKKDEPSDQNGEQSEEEQTPELMNGIPRGIQVSAGDTNTLSWGFKFPPSLLAYDVSKSDWEQFSRSIRDVVRRNPTIAYAVENMCDVVADWGELKRLLAALVIADFVEDKRYFRTKGLIVRIDMPGEEKYGIDFMDLLGSRRTYNVAHAFEGKIKEKKKKFKDTKEHRLKAARQGAFASTRIVLDPVSVLSSSKLAYERGWTQWIKACAYAEKATREKRPVPVDNEPWDFTKVQTRRVDRWPPSKHLYYDRFRGHNLEIEGELYKYRFFIPDEDSMDKRGFDQSIISCDMVERRPRERNDQSGFRHEHVKYRPRVRLHAERVA